MSPRDYVGRGMEDIPGKPFGFAFNMEREAIRAHLLSRGLPDDGKLYFRICRLQERIHKNRPSMRQRQEAAKAARPPITEAAVLFTFEELERLADLFAGANDPVTASIAAKAVEALAATRP